MSNLESIALISEKNPPIDRRGILKLGLLIGGSILGGCATTTTRSVDNISVMSYDASISEQQILDLAMQAKREYGKISKYLGIDYPRSITIIVSKSYESPHAYFKDSRLSGTIELPSSNVIGGLPPTAHELAHIIADKSAEGSYISEGLSVYLQDKFGENRAHPNFGRNLHEAFYEDGVWAGKLKTPMPKLRVSGAFSKLSEEEKKSLYLQSGSFVKYLIEEELRGSMEKFMQFYYLGNFKMYFGKEFYQLGKDWLKYVERFK